ncbi:hypothetical protein LOTGIDRAFT_132691 [Lottia gigantea]|uniref:Mannose-P-dolichol utilization defect 1 protein homolog n=1 Tax=Lottia gigantea TaxID=225164 RepID=V3ZI46_LOTGI|nr:hypothetical protein LOTGIDRAFT_132691 [Lottia gigantea]ESO83862.1 hypothetical protein LOTGIDRAFT_132691 [Lottia gigantea]
MSNSTLIPAFLVPLLQIIAPQPCFNTLFISLDLLHVACLKVVISKCLGFAIIAGSCIVKLPQVIKILRAKSGEGISLPAVTLELIAITASLSYGFAHGFPFSSYGEAGFLVFQTAIIAFLVLLFSGKTVSGLGYIAVYVGILAYLLSPSVNMSLLAGLQASGAGIVAISKMIQAHANFKNGSTGQLSAVTVFLLFFGSVARIFTSIQETGDKLVIFQYVVSTAFNGLIVAQMIYYWNSSSSKSKKTKSRKAQ